MVNIPGQGFGRDFFNFVMDAAQQPLNTIMQTTMQPSGLGGRFSLSDLGGGGAPTPSLGSSGPPVAAPSPFAQLGSLVGQLAPFSPFSVPTLGPNAGAPFGNFGAPNASPVRSASIGPDGRPQTFGSQPPQQSAPPKPALPAAAPADQADRRAASATAAGDAGAAATPPPTASQDPNKALAYAKTQIGKRYAGPVIGEPDSMRWGNPGWDCSSFVSSVFAQVGVKLTPYTDAIARETPLVGHDLSVAQPGDIILYKYNDPSQPKATYPHVAIYLGDGQIIDAEYSGGGSAGGVQIRPITAVRAGFEVHRVSTPNQA
jgi:cell wall-associated NlpC family hydrolase